MKVAELRKFLEDTPDDLEVHVRVTEEMEFHYAATGKVEPGNMELTAVAERAGMGSRNDDEALFLIAGRSVPSVPPMRATVGRTGPTH